MQETMKEGGAMARISAHEEICAVRYNGIIARIGRLETVIISATGGLILGMGGLIATLLGRGH